MVLRPFFTILSSHSKRFTRFKELLKVQVEDTLILFNDESCDLLPTQYAPDHTQQSGSGKAVLLTLTQYMKIQNY